MAEQSAYAVLGLQKGATEADIKKAYVEMVKRYDPEKHTDRFMLIQNAFNRLKEPKRRAKEDLHTYNLVRGDFAFVGDERPTDGTPPADSLVSGARDRLRASPNEASLKNEYIRLLMQRSCIRINRKLWMEAIHDWAEVEKLDPSHVRARNNLFFACSVLGYQYAMNGLEEDAIELWERALQINPDSAELIHNLALASEKCGQTEKAARFWSEVVTRWKAKLDRDSSNDYLRECIIEAHRHHGGPIAKSPSANGGANATPEQSAHSRQVNIERMREVLKLRPDDFDARFQIAQANVETGNYDEAVKDLQALAADHPRNVEVLNYLAIAMLNTGQVDKAFTIWDRSMSIDPKNPTTRENVVKAHLSLGKQFRQKGYFVPALVHFKKLQRYLPNSAEVYMEIAATYDMKGDVRSARQAYEQVLNVDPKNKVARKALNDLRMRG